MEWHSPIDEGKILAIWSQLIQLCGHNVRPVQLISMTSNGTVQLKQLTSLDRKMADENIALPFYNIFILWLNVILPTSL